MSGSSRATSQTARRRSARPPSRGARKRSAQRAESERSSVRGTGGERGIRTPGTRKGTTVFETAPFNRSGISPGRTLAQTPDALRQREERREGARAGGDLGGELVDAGQLAVELGARTCALPGELALAKLAERAAHLERERRARDAAPAVDELALAEAVEQPVDARAGAELVPELERAGERRTGAIGDPQRRERAHQ